MRGIRFPPEQSIIFVFHLDIYSILFWIDCPIPLLDLHEVTQFMNTWMLWLVEFELISSFIKLIKFNLGHKPSPHTVGGTPPLVCSDYITRLNCLFRLFQIIRK